ncbi:MAG: hypothetical protein PHR16_08965 [Methylovulum sp.]|nr:hypothetical protein [Methylovulum sp.]
MFKQIILLLAIMQLVICKTSLADGSWVGLDFNNQPCNSYKIPTIHVATSDYTNPEHRKNNLPIVEEYHFSPALQRLLPESAGGIDIGGLHYTLRAFPNHHKALNAVMYYQLINDHEIKLKKAGALTVPVECYMKRAIHFSPHDIVSYMLYASYLKKVNHFEEANNIYKQALKVAPTDLRVRYSYGLFLMGIKKYTEALAQAEIIYKKNYPKQKLKQDLIAIGQWEK